MALSMNDLEVFVRSELRSEAVASFEQELPFGVVLPLSEPDPVMAYSSYPQLHRAAEEEMVDSWWNDTLAYEEQVTAKADALYEEYSASAERLALSCVLRLARRDPLRKWAARQLDRAQNASPEAAVIARLFVWVTLRQVVEWNLEHLPEQAPATPLAVVQAEWVDRHERDRDNARQVVYLDDKGDTVTVTVTDSPSTAHVDASGWDRATSVSRVKQTKPRKSAPADFSTWYTDSASNRQFERTRSGWYYNGLRCATSIEQQLYRRVESGRLVRMARS
jgi:hypothetical protein